jgi:hypothetical protein
MADERQDDSQEQGSGGGGTALVSDEGIVECIRLGAAWLSRTKGAPPSAAATAGCRSLAAAAAAPPRGEGGGTRGQPRQRRWNHVEMRPSESQLSRWRATRLARRLSVCAPKRTTAKELLSALTINLPQAGTEEAAPCL